MGYFWKGDAPAQTEDEQYVCAACTAKVFKAAGRKWLEEHPGQLPVLHVSVDFNAKTVTVWPDQQDTLKETYTFAEIGIDKTC